MAILDTLKNSSLLHEQRPALIMMFPKRLAHLARPGARLRLFHGYHGPSIDRLLPLADYALSTQFAKMQHAPPQPFVFMTTDAAFASLYGMDPNLKLEVITSFEDTNKDRMRDVAERLEQRFGSVFVIDLQIPIRSFWSTKRRAKVERLVNDDLNHIVVLSNQPVFPIHEHITLGETMLEIQRDDYPHPEQNQMKMAVQRLEAYFS